MSAPIGNKNNVKHGMRMALNELPEGCGRIRRERYKWRQSIERAILDQHGTISPYEAGVVQTAMRWATHAALAARWLRLAPDLTIDQKLNLSRAVALASESKDRCLKALGLDKTRNADPWDVLDASPTEKPQEPVLELPAADTAPEALGDTNAPEGLLWHATR